MAHVEKEILNIPNEENSHLAPGFAQVRAKVCACSQLRETEHVTPSGRRGRKEGGKGATNYTHNTFGLSGAPITATAAEEGASFTPVFSPKTRSANKRGSEGRGKILPIGQPKRT